MADDQHKDEQQNAVFVGRRPTMNYVKPTL